MTDKLFRITETITSIRDLGCIEPHQIARLIWRAKRARRAATRACSDFYCEDVFSSPTWVRRDGKEFPNPYRHLRRQIRELIDQINAKRVLDPITLRLNGDPRAPALTLVCRAHTVRPVEITIPDHLF